VTSKELKAQLVLLVEAVSSGDLERANNLCAVLLPRLDVEDVSEDEGAESLCTECFNKQICVVFNMTPPLLNLRVAGCAAHLPIETATFVADAENEDLA
jgi:hypothetical protein